MIVESRCAMCASNTEFHVLSTQIVNIKIIKRVTSKASAYGVEFSFKHIKALEIDPIVNVIISLAQYELF